MISVPGRLKDMFLVGVVDSINPGVNPLVLPTIRLGAVASLLFPGSVSWHV